MSHEELFQELDSLGFGSIDDIETNNSIKWVEWTDEEGCRVFTDEENIIFVVRQENIQPTYPMGPDLYILVAVIGMSDKKIDIEVVDATECLETIRNFICGED